ncbi:MAG: DUF5103 domain-containing protein [Bacteroidales bacterium]|nr:DUF5103 domain-containing protein [Bacteroidales bacterium]
MHKIIIFILITIFSFVLSAQSGIFFDKVFKDNIKTVQIRPKNSQFSYPIINLNSAEKLIFSFDDLNPNNKVFDYQYTIIHCNADWTQSDLIFDDYCNGFEENNIYDYTTSFNTLVNYVNFSLELPNNDIDFKLSGNYIIFVYKDYDIYDTVLTKRFSITENSAIIDGTVISPQINAYRQNYQQVEFNISSSNFDNGNNIQYLKVNIFQNNRPDIALTNIKPDFINGKTLKFSNPNTLIFKAGNEFRFFDAQNIRFASEKVADIKLIDEYNFFLVPENQQSRYFFHKDINGKYVINNQLGTSPNSDADYIKVHFYLPRDYEFPNNNVYIFGELTNWQLLPDFKMDYNNNHNIYQKTILLKQGYYNYCLVLENKDLFPIDGSFFETENDYVIYVYLHDFRMNYDKLIAAKVINTNF